MWLAMKLQQLSTATVFALALLPMQLLAAEPEKLELQERYVQWREDYTVNDDYTVDYVQHFQLQVLSDNAAHRNKEYSFSYSTSIEKVDVEEAYTRKSDGRRIDVPKSNYQVTVNHGKGEGGPVFSDRTSMTIVYPELETGDSIVLTMRQSERVDFSAWEWESQAGFAISSFDSYENIARAYGARALTKAQPTHRVRELAAKIVGEENDSEKVARLLYDWVAANISYAGNCIGVGAVVPHDLDFILDNRMGDCKDHATLLQALYTSSGIKSVQALINSGSSYSLPSIPMVSSVNHVINYIPKFNHFIDSTNPDLPYDSLDISIQDKPVLLVEGYQEGLRTPPSEWQASGQKARTTLEIHLDGSASGKTAIALTGRPAIQARAIWRQLTQQQEQDWLNDMYSSATKKGSATIVRDDPKALTSTFSYSIDYKIPELIPAEGAGGTYLHSPGFSPLPVYAFVALGAETDISHDVACANGHSTEKIHYTFPANLRILAVPDDFSLQENHLTFQATYRLSGNTLEVARELQDQTPGNVCSVELTNAQRESRKKIAKNLKAQLVFQYL